MSDLQVGLRLGRERLRGSSAPLTLGVCCLAVFAVATLERSSDAGSAVDDTLSGVVFGVALPLLAYLVSERVCAGGRLEHSVDVVARYGCERRPALLGLLLVAAVATAFASALVTLAGLLGAHSLADPRLLGDVLMSLCIALLAGAVYALWFAAASHWGQRGGGRKWALILDFLLGAGSSSIALLWPRAHVRNLLGGEAALGWSQTTAWVALISIAVMSIFVSVRRTAE